MGHREDARQAGKSLHVEVNVLFPTPKSLKRKERRRHERGSKTKGILKTKGGYNKLQER